MFPYPQRRLGAASREAVISERRRKQNPRYRALQKRGIIPEPVTPFKEISRRAMTKKKHNETVTKSVDQRQIERDLHEDTEVKRSRRRCRTRL